MSWRDAPLYVRCFDLARALLERAGGWSGPAGGLLREPIARAADELVCAVALALTFPRERGGHLAEADRSVVRLRERLRLARELGLLSAGAHRLATTELADIGRMIGGWRRRVEDSERRQAARPAACAGVEGPRVLR